MALNLRESFVGRKTAPNAIGADRRHEMDGVYVVQGADEASWDPVA